MTRYLDIHSHTAFSDPDVLTLCSLYTDFFRVHTMTACSIGLHPWHLDNAPHDLETLTALAHLPQVFAIGECGLDKTCATSMATQEKIFTAQIDLANRVNKPLIIHCVRAFAEAIALLKQARVPVIFHGFQKNPALMRELLDQGYYLSFGAALTQGKKNAIDSWGMAPTERLFLETDDSALPIQTLYHTAASLRDITEDTLVTQLQRNYQTVFNR